MKRIAPILFLAALALPAGAQSDDAPALYELGRDALTRGRPKEAAAHLEKAVAQKPNDARYRFQLGNGRPPAKKKRACSVAVIARVATESGCLCPFQAAQLKGGAAADVSVELPR